MRSLNLDRKAPSFPGKSAEVSRCISQGAETPQPVACCWPTQTCSYVEKVIHVDRCRTSWYSRYSRYSIGEREEASQALARADGLGLQAANMDGSGTLGRRHYFRMHGLLLHRYSRLPNTRMCVNKLPLFRRHSFCLARQSSLDPLHGVHRICWRARRQLASHPGSELVKELVGFPLVSSLVLGFLCWRFL